MFEVAAGSGFVAILTSFDGNDGAGPNGVTLDASGNLFGTTIAGGDDSNDGTVFEIAHDSHAIQTLVMFNRANGTEPGGPLIFDGQGHFYGTTISGGGPDGGGTVFPSSRRARA